MDGPLYVFGYGSLMWRPGFRFGRVRPGLLRGARRALCVFSWVHRGTEAAPGLVLGLDRGGACRGLVFEVAAEDRSEVIAYLRAREQVTGVYLEAVRPVRVVDPVEGVSVVPALTYLVDRRHPQYAGALDVETQAALVRRGVGVSGANPEYVLSTLAHLRELGIHDPQLEAVAARLGDPAAAGPPLSG